MKKTLLLIAMMLCCATAILAQNNRISYQAVVRDAQNRLVANKTVTVTVNIYNVTETTAAYTETQTATTNLNGLVSLQIGPDGDNAAWSNIQWKNASIKTTVTLDGTSLGTLEMPLTAVPYALYADYADSVNLNVIANYLASHNIPDGAGMNVQSDWNQTDTHADDYIKNKPDLATVATTGNYNDLSDKPTIPAAQVNADWNATSGVAEILHKPTLATVATSGNYNDLSNKPTIPAAQVNADWNASSGVAQILNKPALATVATTGNYNDLSNTPNLATVATTGSYNDLSNTPNLATVATTGNYNDLSDKPTIPAAQVNADWNATSGVAEILHKPTIPTAVSQLTNDANYATKTEVDQNVDSVKSNLRKEIKAKADTGSVYTREQINTKLADTANYALKSSLATVATTGNYNDLSNKPNIPAAQVNADWNASSGVAQILNKPALATVATTGNYNDLSNTPNLATVATTGSYNDLSNTPNLATVATTGNYNDLSNKPTIPAAQVNADWNASSGVAQILNKPTLATVATTGNYNDLSNTPNLATVATTGSYNDLSNTPNLATVATTGSYNDLSNTPNLATVATTGNYNDLNNKPNIKDTIGGYLDTCTVVANMKTDLTKLQNGIKKAALCDSVADCVNSRINSSLSTALSNYATKAKVKQDSIDICALIATSSAGSGTLNTNNTNALDVESSETISGEVKLHKISKTGSYGDLNNRPSIKDTIGGYLDTCTVVTTMQTDINGLQTNVTKLQNGIKKAALCDSVADCVNSRISTALSNYATKAKVKQDSIDICALIPTTVAELTDASDYVTTTYLGNQNYVTTTYLNNQHYVSDAGCPTVDICALVAEVATLRTDMRKSIDSLKKTIDTLKNVIDSLEGVINDFSGDIPPTTDVPDGAIDGRFTINGDQAKVYFSQGNLQATYDGTAWSWAFADNQYDYIGNAEGNTKVTDSSPFVSGYSGSSTTVDLFGWVGASSNWNTNTGVNMYGITSSTATANKDGYGNQRDDALNSDWGTLAITNGGNTANSGWRTLTYDEWEWILGPSSNPNPGTNCRTSSTVGGTENARYAKATVDGKAGLIIFPDSYTHPSDVTAPTSININAATVAFTVNTYDATAWEKMEEAGAVFLPDAGYRNGATVSYVGGRGGYWTSSPYNKSTVIGSNDNKKAYYLSISSKNNANDVKLNNNDRHIGYSVRLVKGANN